MRKLCLLITSVTLVCLISGFFTLHSQQPERPWSYEVATPVQQDDLTPQQREHSKLYESYGTNREKIRDYVLKNSDGIQAVTIVCPFLSLEPLPDVVTELSGKADAVVTASFVSKSSQITASGKYVFTDYQLRVEDVLKNLSTGDLKPEMTITVTRPGGRVLLFGHSVSFTTMDFKPLLPGRRYLLFLTYIPSTKGYSAVNHESSFDITDTRVETLSEAMVRPFAKDLREFITSVKTAIAAAQRKGGAQ